MRILILFCVGLLFLSAAYPQKVNIASGVSIAEDGEVGKARVVEWMSRHSNSPVETLDRIYDEAHRSAFPELLLAIAKVESNFDPGAVSRAGAVGLMQVMAGVWAEELKEEGIILRQDDLFDVSRCMAASSHILSKYLRREGGNLDSAMRRYVGARKTRYQEKVFQTVREIRAMKCPEETLCTPRLQLAMLNDRDYR